MNRTNIISCFLSRNQIRTTLKPNRKTMKLRPPCSFLRITFNTLLRKFLSNSSNDRRIQTATQKNTIRHITHKLLLHSRFKPVAHLFNHTRINYFPFIISSTRIIFYSVKIFPLTLIPAHRFFILRIKIMTVWKLFNSLTLTFQSLQFRSYIKTTSFIPSLIKRNNTNFITSNKINIIFTVIKRKSKNSTQFFNHQSKITTFPKLFI